MFQFLFCIMIMMLIALVFSIRKWGKNRVKRAVSETVSDVKEVVGLDPIDLAHTNLKKTKQSMAELVASTHDLKVKLSSKKKEESNLIRAGKAAKKEGNNEDFEECCGLHASCVEAIAVMESDIQANESLYDTIVKQVSKQQVLLNKAEASKARVALRKEANKLRLKIARDSNLAEGIFEFKEEEICEEELEAIGHEKVASDLGENVIDKYKVNDAEAKSKFEALCSE